MNLAHYLSFSNPCIHPCILVLLSHTTPQAHTRIHLHQYVRKSTLAAATHTGTKMPFFSISFFSLKLFSNITSDFFSRSRYGRR